MPTRVRYEESKIHWQLEDKEPPLSLPWGTVYPPNGVSIEDPSSEFDYIANGRRHYRAGTWSKRAFLVVDPRRAEDDGIGLFLEVGGVFTPSACSGSSPADRPVYKPRVCGRQRRKED